MATSSHRRDAESAEEALRVESFSLRLLRVFCVSAVKAAPPNPNREGLFT
jgi:hypothetical protein